MLACATDTPYHISPANIAVLTLLDDATTTHCRISVIITDVLTMLADAIN
jgi:hypothetical protein